LRLNIGRLSGRSAIGGPAGDEVNLMFGESPRIGEVAEAGLGKLGRHEAGFGYPYDLGGVFFDVFK